MNNELFRKSSMDRLNSPEQLNEYIRVAKPGVWLILTAIILLLAGALAWGVFGLIESKVECGALVEDGRTVLFVGEADAKKVQPGDSVSVAEITGTVKSLAPSPITAGDEDAYLLRLSGLAAGELCYAAETEITGLMDGVYPAVITVESLRPISFVIQ